VITKDHSLATEEIITVESPMTNSVGRSANTSPSAPNVELKNDAQPCTSLTTIRGVIDLFGNGAAPAPTASSSMKPILRDRVPGQWAPARFNVTTPTIISPTPTTFATDIGEPRNNTAMSTMAAVPIADHSA
jgi:hypothetical protein